MKRWSNSIRAGLCAGLTLLAGCGGDPLGGAPKPPEAVQFDPTRPFGNAAPSSARKSKKVAKPGDDFVPKNPKLARERQG